MVGNYFEGGHADTTQITLETLQMNTLVYVRRMGLGHFDKESHDYDVVCIPMPITNSIKLACEVQGAGFQSNIAQCCMKTLLFVPCTQRNLVISSAVTEVYCKVGRVLMCVCASCDPCWNEPTPFYCSSATTIQVVSSFSLEPKGVSIFKMLC